MYTLKDVITDSYNMRLLSSYDEARRTGTVLISIGGSRREFSLSSPLSVQISNARESLGCSPLTKVDEHRIDEWQKAFK
jgi:hypothetical protein